MNQKLLNICLVLLIKLQYLNATNTIANGTVIPWTIKESVTIPQKLCFDCTLHVDLISVSPSYCMFCFDVWKEGATYCLFYLPGSVKLDHTKASSYQLDVSCSDETTQAVAAVNLGVEPNFPPEYKNLLDFTTLTVNTGLTKGQRVTTIQYTDGDDSQVLFTLEETPDNGYFRINNLGDIYALKDLNTFCDRETLRISLTDNHNPVIYRTIYMDPGTNIAPVLKDWNRIISYPENRNPYLTLTDRLATPGTCIVDSIPAGIVDDDLNLLSCPAGTARSSVVYFKALTYNHEKDPPLNLTLTYDNGNCPSNRVWLYINWADVPEEPTLSLTKTQYYVNEGFINVKPDYIVEDEDLNENHKYSFVGAVSAAFKIDINTGEVSSLAYLRTNTEVDTYSFSVQVQDKDSLISNVVNFKIHVTDVNDNPPILADFAKNFQATECNPPVKFLTVTASDQDFGQNKQFKFIASKSGSLLLNEAGELYLTKAPIAGQVDTLTVQAIDRGEPPLVSVKETVKLYGTACPTTEPPPPPPTQPVYVPPPTTPDPPTPPPTTPTEPPNSRGTSMVFYPLLTIVLVLLAVM